MVSKHYTSPQVDVVERRARHALGKAQTRLHLVEGYLSALAALDDVVKVIMWGGVRACAAEGLNPLVFSSQTRTHLSNMRAGIHSAPKPLPRVLCYARHALG